MFGFGGSKATIAEWEVKIGVDPRSRERVKHDVAQIEREIGPDLAGMFGGLSTGAVAAAGPVGVAMAAIAEGINIAGMAAARLSEFIGGIALRDNRLQAEVKAARNEWHDLLADVADPALEVARDAFKEIAGFLHNADRSGLQDATAEIVASMKLAVELAREFGIALKDNAESIKNAYRFSKYGIAGNAASSLFETATGGLGEKVREGMQLDRQIRRQQARQKEEQTTRNVVDYLGRQLKDAGDMAKHFGGNMRRGAVRLGWEGWWGANRFMGDLHERKNDKIAEQREVNKEFAAKWREAIEDSIDKQKKVNDDFAKKWHAAIDDQVQRKRDALADDALNILNNRPRHQFAALDQMWESIQTGIRGKVTDADVKAAVDQAAKEQAKRDADRLQVLKEINKKAGPARAG